MTGPAANGIVALLGSNYAPMLVALCYSIREWAPTVDVPELRSVAGEAG